MKTELEIFNKKMKIIFPIMIGLIMMAFLVIAYFAPAFAITTLLVLILECLILIGARLTKINQALLKK